MVVDHRRRFLALVVIAIIGLMVSVGFVYLSAPDLALTQIAVETVTILLLLLALHFLPKETPVRKQPRRASLRDAAIAVAAGVGVAALAYAFLMRDFETISGYHLANSKTGGGGTNVVNVILVDFRGYDTYGEIIVLGIAGLAIFALMEALLQGPAGERLRNAPMYHAQDRSRDRHPLMMVVATRVMHAHRADGRRLHLPARPQRARAAASSPGWSISIALLMQYMASGFAWTQARQKIEYHTHDRLGRADRRADRRRRLAGGRPFLTSDLRLCPHPADRGVRAGHRDALRPRACS